MGNEYVVKEVFIDRGKLYKDVYEHLRSIRGVITHSLYGVATTSDDEANIKSLYAKLFDPDEDNDYNGYTYIDLGSDHGGIETLSTYVFNCHKDIPYDPWDSVSDKCFNEGLIITKDMIDAYIYENKCSTNNTCVGNVKLLTEYLKDIKENKTEDISHLYLFCF